MLPAPSAPPDPNACRFKRLSTGHIALFNPATQELILIDDAEAADLAKIAPADAWTQALMLVAEHRATKLSSNDMMGVQAATQAVVLLSGSNDWPP